MRCSRGVPALHFLSSLQPASNSPPPDDDDDDDDRKGPRGNSRVSGSQLYFTVLEEEGPHIRPSALAPRPGRLP